MTKGRRRLLIFFSLSLIALIIMTFQHNRRSFRSLRALSYPFDVLNQATSGITDTFEELVNTFRDNRRLRKELTDALVERQRYSEILQENKRLREVLTLREQTPERLTAARVVARGYDRFLNTLILDKGEQSGVMKDMAVITTKGLLGKVYSVRGDFSEVLLLRDPNFSTGVRLQQSRWEGVLSGTGSASSALKYIPADARVEKGEVVITSGLDGLLPAGLPVGVVLGAGAGSGFFLDIQVVPFQADSTVEEVLILKRPPVSAMVDQTRVRSRD